MYGCYNSPPLEIDFVLEICYHKQLGVMLFHRLLGFPRPLETLLVLPLQLN